MLSFFKQRLISLGLTCRRLNTGDLMPLQNLAKAVYFETYADFIAPQDIAGFKKTGDALYSEEKVGGWLNESSIFCVGLVQPKAGDSPAQLIGYSVMILGGEKARLDKIYLLKAYQGKGLGRLLIEECFQALRKQPEAERYS